MDLSRITFELASERYEEIPERFRELLESPGAKTTLARIGAQHSLDHERQVLLEAMVGLVFLGFLSPNDLAGEFVDRLFLNFVHARALAREVDETFFAPHRHDLALVYNPVGGAAGEPTVHAANPERRPQAARQSSGRAISLESIGTPGGAEQTIPLSAGSKYGSPARRMDDAAPLVILGPRIPASPRVPVAMPQAPRPIDRRGGPKPTERTGARFPFRFPMRPRADDKPAGPSAVVRMPGAPAPRGDGPHAVDYSETRTKLGAPLPTNPALRPAEGGRTVNLDQLGGQPRQETKEKGQGAPNQKPQPKIDGNTIDLRR